MRPDTLTSDSATQRAADPVRLIAQGVIFLSFAAMAAMSWTRNVNWDEFYFLSHVHAHLDGRLDLALQTFFVHGFGWLQFVPGSEMAQITAARLVMLGFFGATCLAIYRIAAHLVTPAAAVFAVLAFVTSGFSIPHGASFRADPIVTALLMWALALIMTTKMRAAQVMLTAVLGALAVLVTVKAALYVPVILAALLWRGDNTPVVWRSVIAGVGAIVIAGGLFLWHQAGLLMPAENTASRTLQDAATVTLAGGTVFPRAAEASLWLALSAGGVALAVTGILRAGSARLVLVLILFAAPLLVVVIYRNAFPYYFPFAAAPLMVAVAVGARAVWGQRLMNVALALMIVSAGWQAYRAGSETAALQTATVAEVHRLFDVPTPYIDQNGMMASFPRSGFFMSTWGLAQYRAAGVPVFADLIARDAPKFVLANRDELRAALDPSAPPVVGLLAADVQVLRATYIRYAGVIWLAGQEATLDADGATLTMPFAGDYRIVAEGGATVNGVPFASGEVISLDQGAVQVSGPAGTHVRLIWHTNVQRPVNVLPETGLYAGFWRL